MSSSRSINFAQKIVDLHDSKAVFNFCGGMMFQLVLSEKLRSDLIVKASTYASSPKSDVILHDASCTVMSRIPNYRQTAEADEVGVFHGREVRKVVGAAGGMGFVLQLTSSNDDPEGWSAAEIQEYNGWMHDTGRNWRKAGDHAKEGNELYGTKFGSSAFGLQHRCYWHLDRENGLWLSAEDGCEGVLRSWM